MVARTDGHYPDVRNPRGVYLAKGDVWKYGQTSNPEGRYSQDYLDSLNLDKIPEFQGTKEECLIMEKIKIYNYVINNGQLPPGNKIYR